MRRGKAVNNDTHRKNALSAETNAEVISEKVIPQKTESKSNPTSFRLPADLLEALRRYVYSDANTEGLNRTQVVEQAISEFIKYEK